jgi:hypothetical protein
LILTLPPDYARKARGVFKVPWLLQRWAGALAARNPLDAYQALP